MKYIALLLVLATLATMGYGIYMYLNTNLEVISVSVKSIEARNMSDKFFADREDLTNGTKTGRVFTNELNNGNDYYYIEYTMQLENNLLVDAESLELQVVPKNGDVYQSLTNVLPIIKRNEKAELKANLLSKTTTMGIREFVVSYYVWGIPFSLNYTFK